MNRTTCFVAVLSLVLVGCWSNAANAQCCGDSYAATYTSAYVAPVATYAPAYTPSYVTPCCGNTYTSYMPAPVYAPIYSPPVYQTRYIVRPRRIYSPSYNCCY